MWIFLSYWNLETETQIKLPQQYKLKIYLIESAELTNNYPMCEFY